MKRNGFAIFLALVFAALLFRPTARSSPLERWTAASERAPSGVASMAYGKGLLVAVGRSGPDAGWLSYSFDGEHWTAAMCQDQLCDPPVLLDVTFANGRFVAVGNYGWTYVSANGTNWSVNVVPPSDSLLWNVSYGGNAFVAVGDSDSCPCAIVAVAEDGANWTSASLDEILHLRGVAYGNGRWVAVGLSDFGTSFTARNIFSSTNLSARWRSWAVTETNDLFAVSYGNGAFVAAGHEHYTGRGRILTSTNGESWTASSLPTTNALRSVSFIEGVFVATGASGTLLTSTNGLQWQLRSTSTAQTLGRPLLYRGAILTHASDGSVLKSDPLLSLRIAIGTQPELTICGLEGRTCRIESTATVTNPVWGNRATFRLENAVRLWSDPLTPLGTTRFYRALLLP